jgi:hypothetical protein
MESPDAFRPYHLLAPNIGTSSPHSFAFVDVESLPYKHPVSKAKKVHRFRLGCSSYFRLDAENPTRHDTAEFVDPEHFWSWLETKYDRKRPLHLFAHNAGFDLTLLGLWRRLDTGYFRLADDLWPLRNLLPKEGKRKRPWRGVLVTEDPPTLIVVKHGDCTLKIIDTLNFFPVPLATLGKDHGIAKVPLPSFRASDAKWFERCRVDVRIIELAVLKLVQRWRNGKYGTFRGTAAGLAWNAYRHLHLNHPIEIHGHRKAMSIERAAFFGGECRCFYVGTVKADERVADKLSFEEAVQVLPFNRQRLYHLDSASFYPAFMEREHFPCKLAGYLAKCEVKTLDELLLRFAVIAEVVLKTSDDTFPVKHEGRTRYAIGTFRTCLCGPELKRALQGGKVLEAGQVVWYEQEAIFRSYVQHFWPLRRTARDLGNDSDARFYKLLLNSLPGKLAQRMWRWDEDLSIPAPQPWGEWYYTSPEVAMPQLYRSVACFSQKCFREGEVSDSFPAIPAYLTSYGRAFMADIRDKCGPRNVFYQDTDSLILTSEGYRKLGLIPNACGDDLGQFSIRGVHNTARFFGLKHYALDGKLTYGAAQRDTKPNREGKFKVLRFQKLECNLAAGLPTEVSVESQTVAPSLCHPDGTIGADGWVIPLTLPSIDPFSAFGLGTGKGWLAGMATGGKD